MKEALLYQKLLYSGIQTDESAQSIKRFINSGIKKVIVGNIGSSTFYEIKSSGCKIHLCRNIQVFEVIKKVENGELKPLNEPTLPDSIHSARKDGESQRGGGQGKGMGRGSEMGDERSRGNRY